VRPVLVAQGRRSRLVRPADLQARPREAVNDVKTDGRRNRTILVAEPITNQGEVSLVILVMIDIPQAQSSRAFSIVELTLIGTRSSAPGPLRPA
jgi:hypothetical protein